MWMAFVLACDAIAAPPAAPAPPPDAAPSGGAWFATPMQFFDAPHRPPRAATRPASTFPWSTYLDPDSDEYWRRPDGTLPPAPLIELARNPSPENQARVRAWLQGRLTAARRLSDFFRGETASAAAVPRAEPAPVSWTGIEVDFVYARGCGYCARALPLVAALEARGARVRPLFLDQPLPAFADHPRSAAFASVAGELGTIAATPTFVLRQGPTQRVVEGLVTLEQLERVGATLGEP